MTADLAPLARLSDATRDLAAEAAPHVVSVVSPRARSSGFLWRPDLVVTAEEALADEGDIMVVLAGERRPAKLVGRDPTTDVALLRLESPGGAPVSLAPVPAEIGALALVVGSEHGTLIASLGIVARASGAWRSLRGGEIDAVAHAARRGVIQL